MVRCNVGSRDEGASWACSPRLLVLAATVLVREQPAGQSVGQVRQRASSGGRTLEPVPELSPPRAGRGIGSQGGHWCGCWRRSLRRDTRAGTQSGRQPRQTERPQTAGSVCGVRCEVQGAVGWAWARESEVSAADCGLRTVDCGLWTLDFGNSCAAPAPAPAPSTAPGHPHFWLLTQSVAPTVKRLLDPPPVQPALCLCLSLSLRLPYNRVLTNTPQRSNR